MVRFHGGEAGPWRVLRQRVLSGAPLPEARRLAVQEAAAPSPPGPIAWTLAGSTGNLRYTERIEADSLAARQEGLARPQAVHAALIPIRKNEAWWSLAQDERRAVLEAQSRHIAIGMDYLPAVARRLHHSRELGEPFDFLTWFEYAPEHEPAFDEMLGRLRAQREWDFVEREVEIRLVRELG
ncbi:chlorite dismutase family protein [Roseococcus sp. SDR]|nr:chlorite dismutase family protein [Roseococcus sp. SDR]MBV1846649.1 chlorite dismutase family protein [Roseococcus sp. SDR]